MNPTKIWFSFAFFLLLAVAGRATAQPTTTAYAGPRYPGGPDSLRALVARSIRMGTPGLTSRVLVQLELKNGQEPKKTRLLPAPKMPTADARKSTAAASGYLLDHMLSWQPNASASDAKATSFINLVLDFGDALGPQPYIYADQNPVFPAIAAAAPSRSGQWAAGVLDATAAALAEYLQRQTQYPAEALRRQQQGVVYAYFEVAPTGAIEHPEVLGTAGDALDAEVLRVVRRLPAATTPAMHQGQRVRVYYVLPFTFIMR
ncbi:MAG: hypothetical protein JWR44_1591 [Hymenobacter sp.]|nr:hypothetical protein [Hymenobacter sp.]